MKSVFITGSTGFVGQNLKAYLVDSGLVVNTISLRDPNWSTTPSESAEALIHLAGKAHDTSNTARDSVYTTVNRDLTVEVFDWFIKSEIRDFFYFSSVKAVADTVSGVLTEDVEGKPMTPYGRSKLEAENILLSRTLPMGKRIFIVRPCMIHGPGNKGNLNLLYQIVKKGVPWPLASFQNRRSLLSIDNLSFLIGRMIYKQDLPSGIYNFADDGVLSTNQIVTVISEVLGLKSKLWTVPIPLVNSLVKVGDLLRLPLNSERLKKLTESYVVSNEKIKKALDIDKLPTSPIEGLKKTIKSFH